MKTNLTLTSLLLTSLLLSGKTYSQESSNLPDEYLKNLKNYEFKNTRGMRDLKPNQIPWIPEHRQDPDNWDAPTPEEIAKLKELGINFPDLNFIEGGELDEGQKRQPTHTVEHIIYALPGDAVSLYPYYGLEEYKEPNGENFLPTMDYLETFSHWYDYKSGGRVKHTAADGRVYDLLDFPHDRRYIQITDNHGFYGGVYMSPGTNNTDFGKSYTVNTADEYITAVNDINAKGGKGYIELTGDIDFKDKSASEVPMLGSYSTPFTGTLNGNGHSIVNLTIERGDHCVGLISVAGSGAALYNLKLKNCKLIGRTQVGLAGYLTGGRLTASNIQIEDDCEIKGTNPDTGDHFVGAILGRCDNDGADNRLTIENLYLGGTVGNTTMSGHKNTALCGWLATNSNAGNSVFRNIVVNANVSDTEDLTAARYIRRFTHGEYAPSYQTDLSDGSVEERHSNYSIIYSNCYGNLDSKDPGWKGFGELPDMSGWFETVDVKPFNLGGELLSNSNHRPWDKEGCDPENQERRKAGTSAVFYFPETLDDEWDEEKEYVIAADFSQTFYPDTHINVSDMSLTEPLIAFRHIFRIRDARRQTAQLQESNSDYIRRRQHKVTARGGAPFQIRLDSPLPTGWGTSGGVTNYYFKNNSGGYDRIRQFGIKVLNGETRQALPGTQNFELGSDIRMRRAKSSASKNYAVPEGQFRYHTMLRMNNTPAKGRYIVQIVAKDNSGNNLMVDGKEIIIMQYDINFVGSSGASLVTEKELYDTDPNNRNNNKYRHARDEYLKEKYGDTQFKIDFDNYFKLNTLIDESLKRKMISYSVPKFGYGDVNEQWYKDEQKDNIPVWDHVSTNHLTSPSRMHHSFYKWPVAWESSTYGFGYNYRYNYNMYMLATHSTNVPFHASADHTTQNLDNEEGLYDRLYYKTKRMRETNPNIKQQQGYFYYVNAASDPGVSARLNIDLSCPGERVIVSAWIAEMTKGSADDVFEAANLSFNFVAVMKDTKERVVLHNFITGYIPNDKLGQWCNVYYSFIPRMSEFYNSKKTFEEVDHFELELAHNGESSVGADYAVDDIRAYVVPASASADHEGFACDDMPIDLKVETSFETLIEKLGEAEGFGDTDETLNLYYAIADKETFEETGSIKNAIVGKIDFSNNFSKIPYYTDDEGTPLPNIAKNTAYGLKSDNGDRSVIFETSVSEGKLKIGKEYIAIFRAEDESDAPSSGMLPDGYDADTFFDPGEKCAYYCVFTVDPSLQIKIDGVIQSEFDNISVCENQAPVIQVNVWSMDKEPVEVEKNAYFDWFDGTINDFEGYRFKDWPDSMEILMDENVEDSDKTLKEALSVFRFRYSDAESVAGIKAEEKPGKDGNRLEQWMLDIIGIATEAEANGRQRLMLHQASFVVPPVDIESGASAKAKVVAIPIPDLYPTGKYEKICASPTEIGVKIGNHSPILRHGLSGITYPENLYDVPLRLGLGQLSKDETISLNFSKKILDIPVREALSSDGENRKFSLIDEKLPGTDMLRTGALVLAQTNDPEYRNLGTLDGNQETGHLLWVGDIKELNATPENGADRKYYLAEFDDDFHLKEGYYYRLRFSFEEKHEEESEEDILICSGQDIFTIKIVPEYLKWNGNRNLSWDNDENWERLSTPLKAYAPLDFTKVIIDRPTVTQSEEDASKEVEGENPWLYSPKSDNAEIHDDYDASINKWTANPKGNLSSYSPEVEARIGNPTSLIEYDMTARIKSGIEEVRVECIPWKANRCEQIHFLPGAGIMNQQVLSYDKAWVDIELDHSRWYLLSSPLKDVYAGDFYLPSDNGRQETDLFTEIKFDETLHNRFAPAVYQRGWDKGEAKVYEIGNEDARNAAVKTFWSHAYNDVAEAYGTGTGFSIKTDVSRLEKPAEKVLFRLPKADTGYDYYSQNYSADLIKGHHTSLSKKASYRLNETKGSLTSTTANAGNYFLIGNPFMTYLDIPAFLWENREILEQKFWIITEKGQIAGSVSEEGVFSAVPSEDTEDITDASAASPMQGFFVKTIKPAASVNLSYNESMMRRDNSSENILTGSTRSGAVARALRITAYSNSRAASAALLMESGSGEDVEALDNRETGIPSTVFTAKAGKALSVNFTENLEGTEIGVVADDETLTTIRLEGEENFNDLFLFDASDNSKTPLSDVRELEVKGSVAGRFFLLSSIATPSSSDLLGWKLIGNLLTVTNSAATGHLNTSIYDAQGMMVKSLSTDGTSLSCLLEKGLYIVKISNGTSEKTIKVCI